MEMNLYDWQFLILVQCSPSLFFSPMWILKCIANNKHNYIMWIHHINLIENGCKAFEEHRWYVLYYNVICALMSIGFVKNQFEHSAYHISYILYNIIKQKENNQTMTKIWTIYVKLDHLTGVLTRKRQTNNCCFILPFGLCVKLHSSWELIIVVQKNHNCAWK